jgi:DNA-binding Lrp family transcriptional regulator
MAWSPSDLDDLDWTLVRLLQHNPRAGYQQLATACGVSASTVSRRVERLLQSSVLSITTTPNWSRLAPYATVLLAVQVDLRHVRNVAAAIASLPTSDGVTVTTGRYTVNTLLHLRVDEDPISYVTERILSMPGVRDVRIESVLDTFRVNSTRECELPTSVGPGDVQRRQSTDFAAG